MKKLYLYLIKNTKKINFICLLCCIIPIIAGICLWIWLPDKLICWNTVTASMSGTGSKFEIIFIYPLIMLIIELFIIKLADALINKTVANLTIINNQFKMVVIKYRFITTIFIIHICNN